MNFINALFQTYNCWVDSNSLVLNNRIAVQKLIISKMIMEEWVAVAS